MPRLQLARINFHSAVREYNDLSECERFCQLLDSCLLSGLQQPVDELLRLSAGVIKAAPRGAVSAVFERRADFSLSPILAETMLQTLCQNFEKGKMPSTEPARDFVIAMLKKFVIRDLPKYPRALPGYSHEKRGCGHCKHCTELDGFLVSRAEQERVFLKGPLICKHLLDRLPSDLFQRTKLGTTAKQYSLRVVKLNTEHQVAVNEYMAQLQKISKRLQPFRSEYLMGLLGADAYGEFVMLNKLPESEKLGLERTEESQAGRKRPAGESAELPAAKR